MYKDLLEYLVKNLVVNTDKVEIVSSLNEGKNILKIKAAKEDMGRIIGKEGRIIRSLRELISAYASKNNEKVAIEIEEV